MTSLKPALWGAVGGVLLTIAIGFSWFGVGFGWVTGGTATTMQAQAFDAGMVEALAPICVMQAQADPDAEAKLAGLKAARSYDRTKYITDAGWSAIADIKLSSAQQRRVADACQKILMEEQPA